MKFTAELPARTLPRRRDMIAAGAAVVAILFGRRSARAHDAGDVTLVYVGAEDCPPCRTWQRGDGAAFRASPEFTRLTYREIESPTLFDVLKDEHWPADLRRYRDQLPRGAGVPLWLVVAGDKVVVQDFGESRWRANVLPTVKSLLR